MYRDPELARATHTQDASYLDVIHTSEGDWNPSNYAYHLTRWARGLPLWFSLVRITRDTTAELIKAAPQLIGRSGGAGLDTVTVVGRH